MVSCSDDCTLKVNTQNVMVANRTALLLEAVLATSVSTVM